MAFLASQGRLGWRRRDHQSRVEVEGVGAMIEQVNRKRAFRRNWLQDDIWDKGITFACTNENAPMGRGRMCMNCGVFHPGTNEDEDWICSDCQFRHLGTSGEREVSKT